MIATNIADLTSGDALTEDLRRFRMVNLEDEHSKDWSTRLRLPDQLDPMSRLLNTVEIATAPFHGFIRKKVGTKSHDFRYTICEDSIRRMGLTNDLEEIKQAIKKWAGYESSGTPARGTSSGTGRTTRWATTKNAQIEKSRSYQDVSRLRFVDEMFMGDTLLRHCLARAGVSYSWSTPGVGTINTGNVFINKEYDTGITYWNTLVAGGDCTRLEELLVHARWDNGFGIGSYDDSSFDPTTINKHPINKKTSHYVVR